MLVYVQQLGLAPPTTGTSVLEVLPGLGVAAVAIGAIWRLWAQDKAQYRTDLLALAAERKAEREQWEKERKEYQDRLMGFAERAIPILHDASITLNEVQEGLRIQIERSNAPDLGAKVSRLESAVNRLIKDLPPGERRE